MLTFEKFKVKKDCLNFFLETKEKFYLFILLLKRLLDNLK